jgi:hypothetical protein
VAFDKGDHVVFEASQIVGRSSHKGVRLILHCMPVFGGQLLAPSH